MKAVFRFHNTADFACLQVERRIFKILLHFSLAERVGSLLPFAVLEHQAFKIIFFIPGKEQDLSGPLIGILPGGFLIGNSLAGAVLAVGFDQNILDRNAPGLVITDFRVNIFDNKFIYLIGQRQLPVKLLYDLLIYLHGFPLCLVKRTKIYPGGLSGLFPLPVFQGNTVLLGKKIHGFNLGKLGKDRFLNALLQGHAV